LADRDEHALGQDRHIYINKKQKIAGEPVCDMSEAKLLLREDVKNGVHERLTLFFLPNCRVELLFNLDKRGK
jgi:hypothetical protein